MSRDDKASYYDLELPDGTVVEAQDVTRALLERAALPPYASKCLGTLLERVWRFGAKAGTDTTREAEKVVTEATFLCEALGGVPSFTMRDVARAAHDAGIEIKFSCDDPAARIAELECSARLVEDALPDGAGVANDYRRTHERVADVVADLSIARNRLAELERERDEARKTAQDLLMESQSWQLRHREAEAERDHWRASFDRAESDMMSLRKTLDAERQAAVATAEKLERVRERLEGEVLHHTDTLREGTQMRAELADLRDRYRPRRQSEEPAPVGMVLRWSRRSENWELTHWRAIADGDTWTHQPPAPKGE